jgi:hypothetical protein
MGKIMERIRAMPHMKFSPPASDEQIKAFESAHEVTLPERYKKWLLISDGGDLFKNGLFLFGVSRKPFIETEILGGALPAGYAAIGALNFGDFICFAQNSECIVQWDHETGEEFDRWDCFDDFLEEMAKTLDGENR